jgi:hypothetical protein
MRLPEIFRKSTITIFLSALVLVAVHTQVAECYPGGAVLKQDMIQWGQYRAIKGISAVEFPWNLGDENSPPLAECLPDYPFSGASSVILYLQQPGRRVFLEDGSEIGADIQRQIVEAVDALNAFDMLPILVAFDPDPSCRLESEDAYSQAARVLIETLAERELWAMLVVTESCDDPRWKEGDGGLDAIGLSRKVAEDVVEEFSDQVVSAGGSSLETNQALLKDDSQITAITARTSQLGLGQGSAALDLGVPVIEVIDSGQLDEKELGGALDQVKFERRFKEFRYGYAVTFHSVPAEKRLEKKDGFLAHLQERVDAYQKEATGAVPLEGADQVELPEGEREEGFVPLFNGKDLTGWVPICIPDNFKVQEDYIQTDQFKGGWLRSFEPYSDFILRAEYWIEEGGNAGIYIRAPLAGRQSRIGFEYQIQGQSAEEAPGIDSTGSIYDAKAPEANHMKPGEWNQVEIQCVGEHVTVTWNGHRSHDFDYDDVEFLKNRATRGYIGLQDHYDAVKYRNLRIKSLD